MIQILRCESDNFPILVIFKPNRLYKLNCAICTDLLHSVLKYKELLENWFRNQSEKMIEKFTSDFKVTLVDKNPECSGKLFDQFIRDCHFMNGVPYSDIFFHTYKTRVVKILDSLIDLFEELQEESQKKKYNQNPFLDKLDQLIDSLEELNKDILTSD